MKHLPLRDRRFVIIYTIVNLFALFVNLFEIKGEFKSRLNADNVSLISCYFTRGPKTSKFWPFVDFWGDNARFFSLTDFNGIFNSYDISEFIAYMALIAFIVYYKKIWE